MSLARWIVLPMAAAAFWGCGADDAADVTAPETPPASPPAASSISALSPAGALAGASDVTLTIRGGDFLSDPARGSRVGWVANGDTTLLTTWFVTSAQLIAAVPAALLSSPLTAQVFVRTGDPQDAGRLSWSNALDFRIEPRGPPARLRVVHAEPHAGLMNVVVDGTRLLSDLPYLTNTGYMDVPSGAHDIGIDIPSGRMVEFHTTLAPSVDYTMLPCCALMGNGLLLADDNSAPPEGQARIRFVDYASFASSVKVYVTAPGADLATATPIVLGVTYASDYIEVPAGDYQIRIKPFDSETVMIDSGTLTLASGAVRTAVAVDRLGGGAPYDLLVLEDRNPSGTTGTGTLVVYGRSSTYLGRGFMRGWRQVALDGGPWRTLIAGQRLTYDHISAGEHELRLSNPCTGTHQPSVQTVTAVAGDTVSLTVGVPLPCD